MRISQDLTYTSIHSSNKSLKKRNLISLKRKLLLSKLKNQTIDYDFSSFTIKKSNKKKKVSQETLEIIPETVQEPLQPIPESVPEPLQPIPESVPEPLEHIPEVSQAKEIIPETVQQPLEPITENEIIPETVPIKDDTLEIEQSSTIKIHAHSMQLADQPTIMDIKPIYGYVDSLEQTDTSDTSSIFSSYNKWSSLRWQHEPRNVKMTPRSWTTNEMVSVIKKINVE